MTGSLIILQEAAENNGLTVDEMLAYSRKAELVTARLEAMLALRDRCGMGPTDIGWLLGRHYSTISKHLSKHYQNGGNRGSV